MPPKFSAGVFRVLQNGGNDRAKCSRKMLAQKCSRKMRAKFAPRISQENLCTKFAPRISRENLCAKFAPRISQENRPADCTAPSLSRRPLCIFEIFLKIVVIRPLSLDVLGVYTSDLSLFRRSIQQSVRTAVRLSDHPTIRPPDRLFVRPTPDCQAGRPSDWAIKHKNTNLSN